MRDKTYEVHKGSEKPYVSEALKELERVKKAKELGIDPYRFVTNLR